MKSSDVVSNKVSTRALEQVDWKAMHILATEGAVAPYGKDAIAENSRRTRLHTALDAMMSKMNVTEDAAPRLHAALDKLLDEAEATQKAALHESDEDPETQNRILHEPSEEEGDGEEVEDDAEENEEHEKVKIPYDSLSLDQLQRTLDKTFGLDDGASLSRSTVMDSDSTLKLGEPGDVAMDAIQKFPVAFDINKRARLPWFSTMVSWIAKYPKDTKVRDLDQPTLHKLLRELQTAA
jgi:hypothetical protein